MTPEGVLLAAHRVDGPARAARAARAGADLLEIDVHMRRGVLEVRHAHRAGPVLWERGGVRWARGPATLLPDLLRALPPGPAPMLDLKDGPAALARAALGAARDAGHAAVTLTSRRWDLLDSCAGERGAALLYSAAGGRELARLEARDLPGGAGVCVRADLLSAGAVARLRGRAARVFTWDVEGPGHAARLAGWGVGGLVCDDLALVAALAAAG